MHCQKNRNDKKDLLGLYIDPQVNQEDPHSQGGMKAHHEKQQKLEWPAIGEKEMKNEEEEDENG